MWDDDIAEYNRRRWRKLVEANALFTRPWLGLNEKSARQRIDPDNLLGGLDGRRVLCLASGGGQRSVAYALLGARVTVADLSPEQLQRDREAAAHYGVEVRTIEADMRNRSVLDDASFDVVEQPYPINFVPDPLPVFAEVERVLAPRRLYALAYANPLAASITHDSWNGEGILSASPTGRAHTPPQPTPIGSMTKAHMTRSSHCGSIHISLAHCSTG